jgi:alcohol dehydrogenase (cytochrome c)
MKTLAWAFGLAMLFAPAAMAQTNDELVKGVADTNNVLNHGMGYNLQRFSTLKQINKDTVKRLVPVWNYSFDDNRSEESQPPVYKGVLYVTTNSATMAIDAKTGKQIWKTKVEYPPETPRIVCCGIINRGAAIYDGKIFRTTLDANVIALDAQTGKELWRKNAIDFKTGYSMTVAPLVADGVVITGISGAEFGTRDFIDGWDPKTGEYLWRTYTVPGPGEPGNETWQGDTWKLGGGSTWITGSFDPELHTVYWGVGNPGPFNAAVRPGDNLYTCSVLALDPKSGKIKWHFQFSPNNPFDYDAVAEMVLATLNIDGKPTPVLMDANRNGYFYVLDRTNGKLLAANPYVRVNWSSGIDIENRTADRDRHLRQGARRREGRGVALDLRRQELGADVVQSAEQHGLCQYAQYRRPLQGLAGRIQGRRMVCRYGSKRSVGMAGRTAWLSQGDRSVDRQDQVGRLKRHSTLLRRALDRRRPRLLRAVDRRVRSLRRRHRQEAVAVPDRLRH